MPLDKGASRAPDLRDRTESSPQSKQSCGFVVGTSAIRRPSNVLSWRIPARAAAFSAFAHERTSTMAVQMISEQPCSGLDFRQVQMRFIAQREFTQRSKRFLDLGQQPVTSVLGDHIVV